MDLVLPYLQMLRDCLEGTLQVNDVAAVRTFIAAGGPPAWDICCQVGLAEGQAWVQLQSVVPTLNFPMPAPPGRGFAEWAVSVNLGVLRCAAVPDDQGNPPSEQAIANDVLKVSRDRLLMQQTVECCFIQELYDPDVCMIGAWTPLGPQGGCVGGQQNLTFPVPACSCSPAGS